MLLQKVSWKARKVDARLSTIRFRLFVLRRASCDDGYSSKWQCSQSLVRNLKRLATTGLDYIKIRHAALSIQAP